ncbi:cysteine dioxygenase [Fictibacillus fluitans]|uniref:Cysteine dioxygenase family protein n=1 Tax=Fictibacillus fluitans TaxID=3058422 RepID=A0ABT8HQY3_9BACL|nr:cysteine dioxygenase family protein [Fictibacillus sp. NE201]MDN4523166.1 cysteine dioxygenase family protein [Fictibacillus sp. NE201]
MTFQERIAMLFGSLLKPSSRQLFTALKQLDARLEDVFPFLKEPDNKPYGRQMIYQNDHLEILLMQWSSSMDCSPHDHGQSYGWVQVISGSSDHSIYEIPSDSLPRERVKRKEKSGSFLNVGKGMIHKMGSAGEEPLITLHVYSPPISGMKVYDLNKCAVCIVSEDCGAWWPEEQKQMLKTLQLKGS